MRSVADSSLQASEYLRRIKREAEEAEALRIALEEERQAVAEKFASLDKEACHRPAAMYEHIESSRAVIDLAVRTMPLG